MARERHVDPVGEVQAERGLQPLHDADRRRPWVLGIGQLREPPVGRPVEVEPRVRGGRGRLPGAGADGREGDAGAGAERLLRTSDRHVDAPVVEGERDRAQRAHHVHEDQGARVVGHTSQLLDRLDHAGGGLRLREQDPLHGVLGERPRNVVGPDLRPPRVVDGAHGETERFGELLEALGEEAGGRHQHLVAGREAVGHGGLEPSGSAGGHQQDVGGIRAVELLQVTRDLAHDVAEARPSVVHERAPLGEQDLGRDGCGTGGQDDLGPVHC